LEKVNSKLGSVTTPLCTGMVTVPGGEMSSRFGNIITVNSLLDKLKGIINDQHLKDDYSESEREEISEKVAQGALKYAFLKNRIGTDFVFDINESVSLEGNSGPYIQYTYARTQSVLRKGNKEQGISEAWPTLSVENSVDYDNLDLNDEELALLRTFIKFSEVIAMAAENYAPNLICNFIYDLAQKFNTFYHKHGILEERTKGKEQSDFRLALTVATGQILKNGLNLLGIQAPERM
jgi:arginyl-tRNA synthetase